MIGGVITEADAFGRATEIAEIFFPRPTVETENRAHALLRNTQAVPVFMAALIDQSVERMVQPVIVADEGEGVKIDQVEDLAIWHGLKRMANLEARDQVVAAKESEMADYLRTCIGDIKLPKVAHG